MITFTVVLCKEYIWIYLISQQFLNYHITRSDPTCYCIVRTSELHSYLWRIWDTQASCSTNRCESPANFANSAAPTTSRNRICYTALQNLSPAWSSVWCSGSLCRCKPPTVHTGGECPNSAPGKFRRAYLLEDARRPFLCNPRTSSSRRCGEGCPGHTRPTGHCDHCLRCPCLVVALF